MERCATLFFFSFSKISFLLDIICAPVDIVVVVATPPLIIIVVVVHATLGCPSTYQLSKKLCIDSCQNRVEGGGNKFQLCCISRMDDCLFLKNKNIIFSIYCKFCD